jgi:alkylhydroperoxidase family enzyme
MLDYAAKLTLTPAEMTAEDTQGLHAAGFSDAQVWEATFTASIFSMFNRMADAFGLQPPASAVALLE